MPDFVPPSADAEAFHCPHCGSYAHQQWQDIGWSYGTGYKPILDGRIGNCSRCGDFTLWVNGEMVYPENSPAPHPVEDMPVEVKEDFNEARQVIDDSPRGAAALLRLAMERLAQHLTGEGNRSLHHMIGDLVEDGRIDERVQKALDSVRVTGNESVHPGELDMRDDRETALRLFELVNTVVELTITRENLIEEAYADIPENHKEGIENRDG